MTTALQLSPVLRVSVREDLREGNLLIGVADLANDKGDYVTFTDRPAVVADAERGDEYLVLLEDGRIVVADSIDLDFGDVIDG